jgi:hypothetical protein
MSYQLLGPILTLVAAADLSSSQCCAVTVDSNGKFALPSAGGHVAGILIDNHGTAGQGTSAQMQGVAEWKLGGTVAKGDRVKCDSSGRAVTASAADVLAGAACGICLEGGSINTNGTILLQLAAAGVANGGVLDTALATNALDTAHLKRAVYFSIDGTKSAALPNGLYEGQVLDLVCDAATNTPAGSVTGTFLTQAGASATAAAFNAAADNLSLIWTGAAWRVLYAAVSVTLS